MQLQVNIEAVCDSKVGASIVWHWQASYGAVTGCGATIPDALTQLAAKLRTGEYPGDEIMQATHAAMLALSTDFIAQEATRHDA